MKNIEKHQFKISLAVAITVVFFLISTTAQLSTWKSEMESTHKEFDDRITHVGEKVVDMRTDINVLNERANTRDVELATINTKLANIEALLIEIKSDLKNHNN